MSADELYRTARQAWFPVALWSPELEAVLLRLAGRVVALEHANAA